MVDVFISARVLETRMDKISYVILYTPPAGSGSKSLTSFSLPHGHIRSYTHPLPSGASSRAASPLVPYNVSALDQRASSPDGHKSPARAVSPQAGMRVPGSPLEQ